MTWGEEGPGHCSPAQLGAPLTASSGNSGPCERTRAKMGQAVPAGAAMCVIGCDAQRVLENVAVLEQEHARAAEAQSPPDLRRVTCGERPLLVGGLPERDTPVVPYRRSRTHRPHLIPAIARPRVRDPDRSLHG